MPLTAQQRSHLEKRLREERGRTLELLNRIVADRSSESEQDAAGDLTLMPFHQAAEEALEEALRKEVTALPPSVRWPD